VEDVPGGAAAVIRPSHVLAQLAARPRQTLVDVFAQACVFVADLVAGEAPTLVADRLVDAVLGARRRIGCALVDICNKTVSQPEIAFRTARVLTALGLVAEVPAVVFSVAQQRIVDADTVTAVKPAFTLAVVTLAVTILPFVAAIPAVVISVALQQVHDALAVLAGELFRRACLVTLSRLVAAVVAVVVAVAIVHLVDASAAAALEVLRQAHPATLVSVLVGAVQAVGLAVAQPQSRDAPSRAVAPELALLALSQLAVFALVGLVGAVRVAVALPTHRDALAVVALELVAPALVSWKRSVNTRTGAHRRRLTTIVFVAVVQTVGETVAVPGQRDADGVVAHELVAGAVALQHDSY
jgi:hypothetical protein